MKAGDHIRITREGVSVHAIDVGDRTVIHFMRGEGVKRSRLDQLAPDGARVDVVVHPYRVYVPKNVVARAFSRFADSAYTAMFQSSEEFASWCKTGKLPARPLLPAAPAASGPERALGAATRPTGSVRRRTSARPPPRKPKKRRIAKTGKPAATKRSKAVRGASASAPAKRAAAAKVARRSKKVAKASAPVKRGRAGRSPGKQPSVARRQKRGSSSAARATKPARRPAATKQKRSKAQGKRAASGR